MQHLRSRKWNAQQTADTFALRRAMLRLSMALASVLAVSFAVLGLWAAPEGRLFHIERSTNANIVAYDVRLNPRGTIDTGNPIDGYWVRLAEDGSRKELSGIEKRLAYGWNAEPQGEDRVLLSLRALPERQMMVARGPQGYEARLYIAGQPARLVKVFVQTREGGVLPKVQYVDLFGQTLKDGEPIHERLHNR